MKTGDGVIALLIAHGICCGLIVFGLAGTFTGLIGWISDIPTAAIIGVLLLTIALVMVLRRRKTRSRTDLSGPGQVVGREERQDGTTTQ